MVRVYSSYGAMKIFTTLGLVAFGLGVAVGVRFLYFLMFTDHGVLHVQSLILAAVLMLTGVQMILAGIAADLINSSRSVMEDVSYRLRRMESDQLDAMKAATRASDAESENRREAS
jgi:cytochrome c oxidase assembly factor CtaG